MNSLRFQLYPLLLIMFTSLFFVASATTTLATESIDEDELPDTLKVEETQQKIKAQKLIDSPIPAEIQVDEKELQETPFAILGGVVQPGTLSQLYWAVELNSIHFNIPVIVAHGKFKGPVIGITAALHGDELNGIEIARQVLHGIDLEKLAGTLVAVPIVNIEGFVKQSRYMADRRDLNRYFPGNPEGVTPARFADELFQKVILKCNALIDLHTGSYYRTNLPQLRADLTSEEVSNMVTKFGGLTVLHSEGSSGMLRNAATAVGIPAVTMEVGGPLTLDPQDVSFGVRAVNRFLSEAGMIPRIGYAPRPQPVFYESQWIMADSSGILLSKVELGDKVNQGDQLAKVVNPVTNEEQNIVAPFSGTILGKAQNQFVSAGYVVFRLGERKTEEEVKEDAEKKSSASELKQQQKK